MVIIDCIGHMSSSSPQIALSRAKATLSEIVRAVRSGRQEAVITVGGEPAVRIVPIEPSPRPLTHAEAATYRALMTSLLRVERLGEPFDAAELVAEGRR